MSSIGTTVTVRGEAYRVVEARSAADCGSKFFGKFTFTLRRLSDGATFTAYGKSVAHNSRLREVAPPAPVAPACEGGMWCRCPQSTPCPAR